MRVANSQTVTDLDIDGIDVSWQTIFDGIETMFGKLLMED